MEDKGKVIVDPNKCFRCGFCFSNFPEQFSSGDEGEAVVIDDKVTENAKVAVDSCPAGAISIVEK